MQRKSTHCSYRTEINATCISLKVFLDRAVRLTFRSRLLRLTTSSSFALRFLFYKTKKISFLYRSYARYSIKQRLHTISKSLSKVKPLGVFRIIFLWRMLINYLYHLYCLNSTRTKSSLVKWLHPIKKLTYVKFFKTVLLCKSRAVCIC